VRRPNLIEELEWALTLGLGNKQILQELGYTNVNSLARQLYRAGRADLARRFENRRKVRA